MESASKVAQRIIDSSPGASHALQGISYNLIHFAIDFASLCKNIKETSIGDLDRLTRCRKLSAETGIDFSYIDKLTS